MNFFQIAPCGVSAIETRLDLENYAGYISASVEAHVGVIAALERCVRLALVSEPDILVQCGSPIVFVKGASFEKELREKVSAITPVRFITMTQSVVDALRALKMQRVSLLTYYNKEFEKLLISYLKEQGFVIDATTTVPYEVTGNEPFRAYSRISPLALYKWSEVLISKSTSTDGILIAGGAWQSLDVLSAIERDCDCPTVSFNQATYWGALRSIGINDKIEGYGKLLTLVK